MKVVGKIRHISLGQQSTAMALIPRQDDNLGLVLGQFVMLGKIGRERTILARIIEIQPDFDPAVMSQALKESIEGKKEIDDYYKDKATMFHGVKLKLLGVCEIKEDKSVSFYSDVRKFPPIDELDVLEPSSEVMGALMYNAVRATSNGAEVIEFQIGELAYGSDPENTATYSGDDSVPVYINVRNLLRARNGVFGKSGYGKSNLVKCLVGMLAKEAKNAGQLLIDTNGEYSLDNSQNDGFLDIFLEAGMPEKVVVYTNRNLTDAVKKKYARNLKPLRIDAYAEPSTVFTIVAESVRRQIRNDELPKYLVKWVNGAETDDDANAWDSVSKKGTVRAMYYAALSNEGIKPTAKRKKCEVGCNLDPAYITKLLSPNVEISEEDEATSLLSANDLPEVDFNRLTDKHSIVKRDKKYYTNHVETMIDYGRWFAENKAGSDQELKDFKDLVLEKSYRLNSIKKMHVNDNSGEITEGLSSSVFRSLKEGKIVILDLALESMRVSDVLTRHMLNHIFAKMSEDFGRTEIRKEFSKRDIVVFIEEAQNYLSDKSMGDGSIYERIAKEGRKFNIGIVYVTQQPSAISTSITSQTENIFALHMSNEKDTQVLHSIKDKYDELTCRFIKDEAAKGLVYIYSEPYQSFVIPAQIRLFNKEFILGAKPPKKG